MNKIFEFLFGGGEQTIPGEEDTGCLFPLIILLGFLVAIILNIK